MNENAFDEWIRKWTPDSFTVTEHRSARSGWNAAIKYLKNNKMEEKEIKELKFNITASTEKSIIKIIETIEENDMSKQDIDFFLAVLIGSI